MEIRHGWATPYGADKFDVSVNETDLERVLTEHGIDKAYWPQLTSDMVFTMLDTLARYLSLRESVRLAVEGDTEARTKAVTQAQQAKNVHLEVLRRVKVALGIIETANDGQSAAAATG